jgi:hypothetical protein
MNDLIRQYNDVCAQHNAKVQIYDLIAAEQLQRCTQIDTLKARRDALEREIKSLNEHGKTRCDCGAFGYRLDSMTGQYVFAVLDHGHDLHVDAAQHKNEAKEEGPDEEEPQPILTVSSDPHTPHRKKFRRKAFSPVSSLSFAETDELGNDDEDPNVWMSRRKTKHMNDDDDD